MDTAKEILNRIGIESVDEMDVNESYTIGVEGLDDLTIEKDGPNRVSIAHHYVQRGDLICDPEIVCQIDNGVWTPVRYTQHPNVHQHNPDGIGMDGFGEQWSDNLRHQGFVEAAMDVSKR